MANYQGIWIRVAGHAKRIRKGEEYPWRCYLDRGSEEIPLHAWNVSGVAEAGNFIPGSNSSGDSVGLIAWIDCFGDVSIVDGVAHIQLQKP